MIDESFLSILRCPITGEALEQIDAETIQRLNVRIEQGQVRFRSGEQVNKPLDAGLTSPSRQWIHGIYNDIPTLIADEAIPWEAGASS